jgi:hypothetical protein
MEMQWVILGQVVTFLVVSTGTIFAATVAKSEERIRERRLQRLYVDRMGH